MLPRARLSSGFLFLFAWLLVLCAMPGCEQPEPVRLNAPPQGHGQERPEWASAYTYHNDQGMLADMSLADIHFVPGSADLSGTGIARLERYAELLATHGGTLHYSPSIQDQELIDARLKAAEAYVTQVMPGNCTIRVVCGLPGGRGMTGTEAKSGTDVAQQAEERGTAYDLLKNDKK